MLFSFLLLHDQHTSRDVADLKHVIHINYLPVDQVEDPYVQQLFTTAQEGYIMFLICLFNNLIA